MGKSLLPQLLEKNLQISVSGSPPVSITCQRFSFLTKHKFTAKLNGAVGNYNAHTFTYPEYDWIGLSKEFLESLDLQINLFTTQIEPHDSLAIFYGYLSLFNTISISLSRDVWQYISIGYFKQKTKKGEVGSSTMPHKVNPIDFENSEGNLGLANCLMNHFREKLPISRLQRDLSDSTVMRNHGVALGYSHIAYKSLLKGLDKLEVDSECINEDLDNHWEVLAEPIQMLLRKLGVSSPYEQLKELTRGQKVTKEIITQFILSCQIDQKHKDYLLSLTPQNYIGKAADLVDFKKPKI